MFGTKLKDQRLLKRFTIEALASESGLSRSSISKIEKGVTSPTVATVEALAGALGVPPSVFFAGDDELSNQAAG